MEEISDHVKSLHDHVTSENLAAQVQQGNVEQFGVLVQRYEKKMLRYARRFLFGYEDAEDIVQIVFIKAYTNIKSFDVSQKFNSWIYRIAHNEFINAIKKKKREPLSLFSFDSVFPHPAAKQKSDSEVIKKEIILEINNYLEKLEPKYREPVILYFIEELSYKEISDIMKIPTATVGVRLRRAKKLIKKIRDDQEKVTKIET